MGSTNSNHNTSLLIWVFLMCIAYSAVAGKTIYVDAGATGGANGRSWADAYIDLQDGLQDPCMGAGGEIWVAAGIYRPTKLTDPCDLHTATFQLVSGTAIYGGFPCGGGVWEDRDPKVHGILVQLPLPGHIDEEAVISAIDPD